MWWVETPENYEIVVLGQLWQDTNFRKNQRTKQVKDVVDKGAWKLWNCDIKSVMTNESHIFKETSRKQQF